MFRLGKHSTCDRPLKVIFPIGTNIFEILCAQINYDQLLTGRT